MAKGIAHEALQHIIERPKHIEEMGEVRSKGQKLVLMAQTLKVMSRTQTLVYDVSEFEREYSAHKTYPAYLKKRLIQLGVKKPRFVRNDGKIYIWSNDER